MVLNGPQSNGFEKRICGRDNDTDAGFGHTEISNDKTYSPDGE
jgi:hypothetical protein